MDSYAVRPRVARYSLPLPELLDHRHQWVVPLAYSFGLDQAGRRQRILDRLAPANRGRARWRRFEEWQRILRLHRPVDVLRESSRPRDEGFDCCGGDDNADNLSLLVHYWSAGVPRLFGNGGLHENRFPLQPGERADRTIGVFRRRSK